MKKARAGGQKTMKVTKTRSEMIAIGRKMLGLDHKRADCTVEQVDGIDVNELIGDELRQWYLNLLDHGDLSMLAPRSVEVRASRPSGESGGTVLTVEEGCRRILTVKLAGWHHAVVPLGTEALDDSIRRQLNRYTAATADRPLAVMTGCKSLIAWPEGSEYGTTTVMGVIEGEDFTFDDSALRTVELKVKSGT